MTTKMKSERETIICRAQDEHDWHVFSEDPRVVRKLTRLHGAGKPKGEGFVWMVPPTGISFRAPRNAVAAGAMKPNAGMVAIAKRRAEKAKAAPGSTISGNDNG
jgi:hypothetical protein